MKDSHGRTIDYLRISLTDRCNFRCIYCMPEDGVQSLAHEDILRIEEIEQAVRVAAGMGIRSIRLTGGEPLVRLGVVDLVRAIAHTPGIENVSMTTNGVLLPKMADDLKQAGLSRVNISLDTLDPAQFKQITRRGELQQTLDGIEAALEAGFNPVKINAVAVRSLDQDYLAFAKLSLDRPLHVRFIEYMPVGESSGSHGCGWGKDDVVPSEELFEHHQRARPGRRHGRARGRRRRPPARLGAGALLPVPERAGHGGLHQPAVAPLLQRVQPPAPHGRRQAAPVLVLGRRVRPAHRAALGRRAGRPHRVRRRPWAPSPTSTTTR